MDRVWLLVDEKKLEDIAWIDFSKRVLLEKRIKK